jgi:hypothetical protein
MAQRTNKELEWAMKNGVKKTHCEECGKAITLDIIDADEVLIGAECKCGYYVTRYMPGKKPR